MRLVIASYFFWIACFAQKGIVTTCSNEYVPYLLSHISILREEFDCTLPIEVWYAGGELAYRSKELLCEIEGVRCIDLMDSEVGDPKEYQGWQMKAYALAYTEFEEVMVMDADLFFFMNPEILFDHIGYEETGAFIFRDRTLFRVPYQCSIRQIMYAKARGNLAAYGQLQRFIQRLIDSPSEYMPDDWRHLWVNWVPSRHTWVSTEQAESGCVLIDKRRHVRGVASILQLNVDREETYKHVYGDKETYWIGLEMANEPYYVNSSIPLTLMNQEGGVVDIVQHLDGELFYQQKWIIPVTEASRLMDFSMTNRLLSEIEMSHFLQLHQLQKDFH